MKKEKKEKRKGKKANGEVLADAKETAAIEQIWHPAGRLPGARCGRGAHVDSVAGLQ